jgi:GT2 family glycosyltransferase
VTPIRVSVVVPTLDTRELALACVESVRRSRLPGGGRAEVVVVDDGSTDGTTEALAPLDGEVRVVRNERPTGFSRAVNRGVAEATGDVLVLLNSDTEVEVGALASLAAAFEEDDRLGVAGASLLYPDGTPQWSAGAEPGIAWLFAQASGGGALLGRLPAWRRVKPLHPSAPADVAWVSGAAMAVRRAVWSACGAFDTGYAFYAQDLDFCLRAGDAGWRVRVLPAFRVLHHHGATITAQEGGASGNANLGLLWADLVTWARKRKGPAFAARARAAILAGSGLRLAARAAAVPFLSAGRRGAWRAEIDVIARARRRLAQDAPPAAPGPSTPRDIP